MVVFHKEPEFTWNPELHTATCVMQDQSGRTYQASAMCHEDDFDFESERTGCEIAFRRAKIMVLCSIRDNELKPALKALNQVYYSMAHSPNFNRKSYEAKTLIRHIRMTEFDLATIKEMLTIERQKLTDYINGKDKFYRRLRAKKDN